MAGWHSAVVDNPQLRYDANHNRQTMVATVGTSSFTTAYTYDAQADQELRSKTDPSTKTTVYSYDAAGNLTQAVYDPTTLDPGGANQVTQYAYDTSGRLISVNTPDGTANGTTISFSYDADGNRASKTVTTAGPAPTTTVVRDVYQAGRIAYQTDGNGTTLATFTYDSNGVPASVQVGANLTTAPRYVYVYNGHGDVVALVDACGNTVATYNYDAFGGVTASETFATSWSNPYRYDSADRMRYDTETSLYWMSVRAYDPTLGRFLSRDPLNRQPLVWQNQPYAYAGNDPLSKSDPSGRLVVSADLGIGTNAFVPVKRASTAASPAPGKNPTGIPPTPGPQPSSPDKPTASDTSSGGEQCADSCRSGKTTDGLAHLIGGMGTALVTLGSMFAACWIGPACAAWAKFSMPIALQGVHWILDGVDTLHQLAGNALGDPLTLTTRAGKVAIDVLQVVIGVKSERICKLGSLVAPGNHASWSMGASCPNKAC